jgi:hypothetical protein
MFRQLVGHLWVEVLARPRHDGADYEGMIMHETILALTAWGFGRQFRRLSTWALLGLLAACGGGSSVGDGSTTHTVSVTVTGLRHSYNGMTLQNNGGDKLVFYGDGTRTFATALASGAAYSVTVLSQPAGPDQTCTVSNGSGTMAGSNIENVAIDCPYPASYAVGGTVSGMTGTGLSLVYSADNVTLPSILSMAADGSFNFDAARTSAVSGTVYNVSISNQPTGPAQTCVVNNGSGTVASADVSSVRVVCGYYQVSVTVSGLRPTARGLTLRNNGIDGMQPFNGKFTFYTPLANGSAYNVSLDAQPTGPSQTCVVNAGSGTITGSDVNVLVDCPYPTAHAVGGTVSGLTGTNLQLRYNADNISFPFSLGLNANGAYAFDAATTSAITGSQYSVSIAAQPTNPDQTCVVAAGSGTVAAADINNVNINCGPAVVPSTCVTPTGVGTNRGSVTSAQTWTEAGSPHIVPFDISIYASVTIEPCAVVRVVKGATITVNPGGSLVAAGALGRPVSFEAKVAGQAWSTIRNLGGTLSLTHASLTGGGDPLNTLPAYAGVLRMQSNSTSAIFHVDDVEIAGSLSQGVYINGSIGFDATSQNLRIHGAAGYPVHVYARLIGSVPSGNYTGNGHDEIAIAGSGGPVSDTQTMHDRGVPYHVGSGADSGRMDINSQLAGQVAVLTIEPGVTLRFPPGGTLNVDPGNGTNPAQGALIAVGTPDKKIVFTSDQAAPKAGDWLGIGFSGAVDPRSTMQNTRVEFAGGASATGGNSCPYPGVVINDAAIRIFGPPSTQFITNSEILSSARFGIDRGWRADLQPDFLASNTFTAVASCKQTTPRTFNGVCPATPACP